MLEDLLVLAQPGAIIAIVAVLLLIFGLIWEGE